MHRVDQKLAKWTELYERLKVARARLREAASEADSVQADLKMEVQLLQRQCGAALDELQAEYARMKDGGDSTK